MSDDSGGLLVRLERRGLLTLLLLAAPAIASAATEQPVLEARMAKEPMAVTIVEGDDIAFSRVANAKEFSQSRPVLTRISLRASREVNFIEDRRATFWVYQASGGGLAI